MKSHARVVVIGGGIVGCSVLYHLTRLGWGDVVLVERDELTSGATWHASGMNHLYAESALLTRVAKESFDLYRSLEADGGDVSCGVHVTGGVRLARSRDGIDEFKRYLGPATALGIDAEIIGPDRVRELWPLLEDDSFTGALHTPGEGYVDANLTTNALANAARRAGAEIYRHAPVVALSRSSSGEWLVQTSKGTVTTEYVVNCAGSWGGEVSRLLGEYLPVLTMEHQYLVTEQTQVLDSLPRELPVLRDPSVPFYCRQERQGLMVSGFEHEAKLNWLDGAPDDFISDLFEPDLERAMPCLEASFDRVPVLKTLGIRTVVNGPIPATPDMQGLLGPAHGLRGYFTCCGIHGGFVQGGLSRYLAEWVVEGQPSVDLSSVDVRRYGKDSTHDFAVARLSAAHTMFSVPANYPDMEPQGARPLRTDSLYECLLSKGAVFGVDNGWEVANWFAPGEAAALDTPSFERANWFSHVAAECLEVRTRAGVLDLSARSKFTVEGAGAMTLLNHLSANDLPEVGCRATCPLLTRAGGIEVIVQVDRLEDEYFCLTAPARAELRLLDWLREPQLADEVLVRNVTADYGVLQLAGPASTRILETVLGRGLVDAGVADINEELLESATVRFVRVDDIDECAWHVQLPMDFLLNFYDSIVCAGVKHGLIDFGMRAYNSLRMERALPCWGTDFSIDMKPRAAGLSSLVNIEKRGFLGRDALVSERPGADEYSLVLLCVDDSKIRTEPWGGEIVEYEGKAIGTVTSGARGHTVNKSLAFAQLKSCYADLGRRLQIVMLGERHEAKLAGAPKPGSAQVAL